jgi:hypothetical protein
MRLFNKHFQKTLLDWQQFETTSVSNTLKVNGFDAYNYLVDLNLLVDPNWITCPLNDRSQFITSPFKVDIARPWRPPVAEITLSQFFKNRVLNYCNHNVKLNLCWSGGIDSTAIVVAFLKHAPDLEQLRIVYSNTSIHEHADFLTFLNKNYPQIEKINIDIRSTALPIQLDGIAITGDPCDELTGCLDPDSAYRYDVNVLQQSWKTVVYDKTKDSMFVEFLENWFALAQKPIETIADARWWMFMQTHVQGGVFQNLIHLKNMFPETIADIGFYDCYDFEDYIYYHTHALSNFDHYKDFLKSYIFEFDQDRTYLDTARKVRSKYLTRTNIKSGLINDSDWLFILDNNTTLKTKNLPLLSVKELDNTFGSSINHFFNRAS